MQASETPAATNVNSLAVRRLARGRAAAWLAARWADFRRMLAPLAVLSITLLLIKWLVFGGIGMFVFFVLATLYLGIVAAYCRMRDGGEVFLAGSGTWRARCATPYPSWPCWRSPISWPRWRRSRSASACS